MKEIKISLDDYQHLKKRLEEIQKEELLLGRNVSDNIQIDTQKLPNNFQGWLIRLYRQNYIIDHNIILLTKKIISYKKNKIDCTDCLKLISMIINNKVPTSLKDEKKLKDYFEKIHTLLNSKAINNFWIEYINDLIEEKNKLLTEKKLYEEKAIKLSKSKKRTILQKK